MECIVCSLQSKAKSVVAKNSLDAQSFFENIEPFHPSTIGVAVCYLTSFCAYTWGKVSKEDCTFSRHICFYFLRNPKVAKKWHTPSFVHT